METPTADELAREQALRAGLAEYELGEEDLALLDAEGEGPGAGTDDCATCRPSPWWGGRTSASRRSSTASSGGARPSCSTRRG